MSDEGRQAIDERKELIETRARAFAEDAVTNGARWARRLGPIPDEPAERDPWLEAASTVAAYRDRYGVTSDLPVGGGTASDAQTADRLRALRAVGEAAGAGAPSRSSTPVPSPPAVPAL